MSGLASLGGAGAILSGVGGITSAIGTLAGGSYAAQSGKMQQAAANYQASQLEQNATQAIASSQRSMLDTQEKTQLAIGTSTARAAASGVNAGAGSAVENVGQLARRGSYQALMDLYSGQSTATGLENQAKGVRYSGDVAAASGEAQQTASYLGAAGTLAGSAGNFFTQYGKLTYPSSRGSFGA
jgi:hypothetical protein